MRISGSSRFTIGQVMVGIAVLASLLAVPRLVLSPEWLVMVCLVGLLTGFAVVHVIVETLVGTPCPACGRWALRRLVRHRFYFRCSACRGRFKRFGLGPWLDASGIEDDARFRVRTEAGTWKGFTIPKDLAGSTSGALLQSKRARDLTDIVKRTPHHAGRRQRSVDAERRVRAALSHLDQLWDRPPADGSKSP